MPQSPANQPAFPKAPTGIRGLDTLLQGGLPGGRSTIVSGAAGCGKTLLAMEFLVHGARDHQQPGLFVSFRESPVELAQNVASFGWEVPALVASGALAFEHIVLVPEAVGSGAFDLSALFARIGAGIRSIGAKRVVIDTPEALYDALPNPKVLRAEIERLFSWLKEQDITALLTAERPEGALSRTGIEEFVSDCVLLLKHTVSQRISTRTLRVVKYRGSAHGTNEYPFLIDEGGLRLLPITAIRLEHPAFLERISTGNAKLDAICGGGFFRGTTVLLTGGAGTGKTTVGATFAEAACARGERALFMAFEESPDQIVRNMGSVGIRLKTRLDEGLLRIQAVRSTSIGLEAHLGETQRLVELFDPRIVVLDPITTMEVIADRWEVRGMLLRLVDLLKSRGITTLATSLTAAGILDDSGVGISSIVDTWIVLRNLERDAERTRLLHVLKSRGTPHSNQVREFLLTDDGMDLMDVEVGPQGVLTGSAREAFQRQVRTTARLEADGQAHLRRELERERQVMEARILELRTAFDSREDEVRRREAAHEVHAGEKGADRHMEEIARTPNEPGGR
ncbi:MAG: circadian clock protein KaiC [Pseudomonadota bacterium]|nr:circadian clock protein KaiC [Pseudomonadota bacterium]